MKKDSMEGIYALVDKYGKCIKHTDGKPCLYASKQVADQVILEYIEFNKKTGESLPIGTGEFKPVELNKKELYILEHTGYLPTVIER